MVSVKLFIAAVAAVIVSTTAHAADMPLPAPQIVYQQQPCCDTGHWYLRGDVGVGVQTFSSFDHGRRPRNTCRLRRRNTCNRR